MELKAGSYPAPGANFKTVNAMKKNVYKNQQFTRVKVVNNILRIFNQATLQDRTDWYFEAYCFAKRELLPFCDNIDQACGVIAALSPVKKWDQNCKCAVDLVKTGNAGHMKQFVDKARRIMNAENEAEILQILGGRKITSFYLNIRYFDKDIALTIDRHALSVAVGKWVTEEYYSGMTAKQYEFFAECYRHAAAKAGYTALTMQSATWLVWRRIKQDYKRTK